MQGKNVKNLKIIFYLLLILLICRSVTKANVQDSIYDKYVKLATLLSYENLEGQGPMTCRTSNPSISHFLARGENRDEAINRLALMCVKENCENIGKMMKNSIEQTAKLSDQEMEDWLQGQGYSEMDRKNIILNRRDSTLIQDFQNLTCETALPKAKEVAVSICFDQLVTRVSCNR